MQDNDDAVVTVRMPAQMRDKLKVYAKSIGLTLNAYMNAAAMEKIHREGK